MMKKILVVAIVAVALSAAWSVFVKNASASKYNKMKYSAPVSAEVADAEKVRSMNDCMSYTANHVSKGHEADHALFSKQFGKATNTSGAVATYNYDDYTKIMLDCSRRLCSCRCLSK